MLKDEIIEFFENIVPFNQLSKEILAEMVDDITMEYYPKGKHILTQGGPPSEFLGVIKKGGVKVFMASGEGDETVIDYRGEGEHFGLLSVVSGDRSRTNVDTIEDTICYRVSRDKILSILKNNPSANEYFLKSFFVNMIDKTYEETRKRYSGVAENEQLLFTTPVKEVIRSAPKAVPMDISIQQAAAAMATHKIGSLVVIDDQGKPVGMVTDRDFREKVVAIAKDVTSPLESIMSPSLVTIEADDNCFEALLRMIHHNIHHIVVLEKGELTGMVTNHDFMLLQGSSPTILVKEIGQIQSPDELQDTAPKFYKAVSSLLRYGAKAPNITGLITELIEKITNSMVDIFEKEHGLAPVDFTLFFFGVAGRREVTLSFQLDMGIVYQDPGDLQSQTIAEVYFKRLAEALNNSLFACNLTSEGQCFRPEHIKSSSAWEEQLKKWGTRAGTAMNMGYFDMRPVRGSADRITGLLNFLQKRAASYRPILESLAADTMQVLPPLGFFKNLVVEKSGEHKNELNLFEKGIKPLADCARIYALEKGTTFLSTMERLHELGNRHHFKFADDMEQAFGYLLTLLIHNQLRQAEEGGMPDNFVNPVALKSFEQKTLKESFQLIAKLYSEIEGDYWSGKILP
jgi:CBS domain-containing protein